MNTEFLVYFYMKTNIEGYFEIYISVSLTSDSTNISIINIKEQGR